MKYKYYEIYYNKPAGAYSNIRKLVAVVENKLVAQDFCARRNSPTLEIMDSEHYNYVEKEFDFEPCEPDESAASYAREESDPSNICYNDITEDKSKCFDLIVRLPKTVVEKYFERMPLTCASNVPLKPTEEYLREFKIWYNGRCPTDTGIKNELDFGVVTIVGEDEEYFILRDDMKNVSNGLIAPDFLIEFFKDSVFEFATERYFFNRHTRTQDYWSWNKKITFIEEYEGPLTEYFIEKYYGKK